VPGFDFCLDGDIPIGAGLSSSAALGMAVLTAIEGWPVKRLGTKKPPSFARERRIILWALNCGIMDMLVSRVARKDQAVLVDCTNLKWQGWMFPSRGMNG